jgi:hypothetical protein|tara:strand:- start:452 stop:604 length:153 start_codon:yes stop_codon:yes gene_type:complete
MAATQPITINSAAFCAGVAAAAAAAAAALATASTSGEIALLWSEASVKLV